MFIDGTALAFSLVAMLADSRREPVEIVQRSLQADHTTLWRWVQRYGLPNWRKAAPSSHVHPSACR